MSDWGQFTRDAQSQVTNPNLQTSPGQVGANPYLQPLPGAAGQTPDFSITNSGWGEQAREWGLQQGLGAGQVQAGPQFQLNQNARETMAQQIGLQQASQQMQSGYLNQDYTTGLAKLGLQDQQNDVQKAALARQPGYLTTLHDLATQGFDLSKQGVTQQAGIARRAVDSSATARGAFTAPGTNQFRSDITDQLSNQLGQVGVQQSTSDTRYNEQIASIGDQNAMLDLQSKSLGLDRNSLKTELERGLDRLGLSAAMSIADLTGKMNSSQIQDQVLAQQIFNAAIQSSDYYAQYFPGGPPATVPDQVNTGRRGPQ